MNVGPVSELPGLVLPGRQQLDAAAADVDDEDVHGSVTPLARLPPRAQLLEPRVTLEGREFGVDAEPAG